MSAKRTFAQHLDPDIGPKRILALDGGGLHGMLTLGMLREVETLLRARHGGDADFRLGDYFDLIAGTVLSLKALMEDSADQVETILQWLSSSPTARGIDREMGTTGAPLGGTPLCSYLHYNVLLSSDWCEKFLGERIGACALKSLAAMDEPDNIPELDRIGRLAGRRLVKAGHFDTAFDMR